MVLPLFSGRFASSFAAQRAAPEEIPTSIAYIREKTVTTSEIYDINGMRQTKLRKGINIVRLPQADGSLKIKKVIIK